MTEPPRGTVTFLFTDLEGSTRLWEQQAVAMKTAMARHDRVLAASIQGHDGMVVKQRGDGVHAVFASATDAVSASAEAQVALSAESWNLPIRVRMAIHTGEADLRDGDYYGSAVNRAARLADAAHGGQVLLSLATEELIREQLPANLELHDLGEHRLPDLAAPDRIFQLQIPGLDGSFPPLRTVDRAPNNLPVLLTEFVGREEEIEKLTTLLGEYRLVTITGSGGVGKTRLALHTTAVAARSYSHGAWFVDLAPVVDESVVSGSIAAALGLSDQAGRSPQQAVSDFVADRSLLLLIDNCEHLVDEVAALVDEWLRSSSGLNVVVTSQEPLDVEGEAMMRIGPMRLTSLDGEDGNGGSSEALRLFEARARAANASLRMTDDDLAAARQICERLDGVPLAIELAAAQVAVLSLQQIADRLDQRFDLLATRRRGDRRHQTLLDTVQWSYSLLEAGEQLLFNRLCVFAGSFSLDAAEEVARGDGISSSEVLPTLSALVRRSLVSQVAESNRYRILETLRLYGIEQLSSSGDLETYLQRHAAHFQGIASESQRYSEGAEEGLAELDADLDNLRAAISWSINAGQLEAAAHFVHSLYPYWTMRHNSEGGRWNQRLLSHRDQLDSARQIDLLADAGWFAWFEGEQAAAEELATASLQISEKSGKAADDALSVLSMSAAYNNQPERAVELAELALHQARGSGDDWTEELKLQLLGVVLVVAEREDEAAEVISKGLEMARKNGHRQRIAGLQGALAGAVRRANPERSLQLFDEAVSLAQELGMSWVEASWVMHRGFTRVRLQDHAGALEDLLAGCRLTLEVRDFRLLASGLEVLALVLSRLGRGSDAVVLYAAGERLREELGSVLGSKHEIESREASITELQAQLGDEFAPAWRRGSLMDLDEAMAVATAAAEGAGA